MTGNAESANSRAYFKQAAASAASDREVSAMTSELRAASDPTTSPAILDSLGAHPLESIRTAVTWNPNSSAQVLRRLATDPERSVRVQVAMSIETPLDVLRDLATDEDEAIRSAALMNARFPADALWEHRPAGEGEDASEECSGEGELSYRALGYEGAEDPLDIDEEDEEYDDELSAAHEEALWEDQQRSQGYDGYDDGDHWDDDDPLDLDDLHAAGRSSTPHSTLQRLASVRNQSIRSTVAANRNTPPGTLEGLASDSEASVRLRVATNPMAPIATRRKLAEDRDETVRCALASDPRTPAELLRRLGWDAATSVATLVAANPNTPPSALQSLTSHTERIVREAATVERNRRLESLRRSRATQRGRNGLLRLGEDVVVFESGDDHVRIWIGKIRGVRARRTGLLKVLLEIETVRRIEEFAVVGAPRWVRAIRRTRERFEKGDRRANP